MARYGWHSQYGERDEVDGETFMEWRDGERERMRGVMRKRRARLKEARAGAPNYPEWALALIEHWSKAHRAGMAPPLELALIVFYLRKMAQETGHADYDLLQDRGVAKHLRKLGYVLVRTGEGMAVKGLWKK